MLRSAVAALLATTVLADCTTSLPAGHQTIQIQSSGRTREFDIYVPTGLVDNQTRPVIFTYHGYASNPQTIAGITGVPDHAEALQWYAVMPSGTGFIKSWNGAGCCVGNTQADVQFARDIVSWLQENTCLDPTAVFSTGFSNGGFMTHRLACEASDVFTAFAPHSGLIGVDFAKTCDPAFSRPILSFHGIVDGVVPYHGNGNWKSFHEVMELWIAANECGGDDQAAEIFRTSSTHCIRYEACKDGIPVEYCDITDLAHKWAGSDASRPQDIDATAYIFQFFSDALDWMDEAAAAQQLTRAEFVFRKQAIRVAKEF